MRYSESRDSTHWCTAKYKTWRIGVEVKNARYKTTFWIKIRLTLKMIYRLVYSYITNYNPEKIKST